MPLCRNPAILKPLLLSDEPGTRSLYNTIFGKTGSRAIWIRVDDLKNPQAVVCRSGIRHRRQMMYAYARNAKAAERVLAEIPRPWKLEFAATPVKMVKAAKRELARRNAVMRSPKSSGSRRRISWVAPCYLYVLESGKLVIDRRHKIGTLKPNDAEKIVSYWPHGRNADYIRWRIRTGPTCAIRRNGKLVAWAITHGDGAMGILHVLKEFRGLGMARSITTALAERSLRAGIKPFLYIVKRNKASIRLTESMGFTRHGIYCWFGE